MSGTEHEQQPTSSSVSSKRGQTVPRWVYWLLAKWWGLLVFEALALLGNILVLPLSQGFARWWPGVQAQVAALIQLPMTQPYLAILLAAVIPVLSLAGWWADRTLRQGESVPEGKVTIVGNSQGEEVIVAQQVALTRNVFQAPVTQHIYQSSSQEVPATKRRHDCYQQINLPPNCLERTGILADVCVVLLAHAPAAEPTSAITTKPLALHGMGGIGKTVIARVLCDDPKVQEIFSDGILWATLGQTPNLLDQLRHWIVALGGRISENAPPSRA